METLTKGLPPGVLQGRLNYEFIQNFLFAAAASQRGIEPLDRQLPDDVYNFALFDVADWTGLHVYSILDSFLDVIQPGEVPVCKAGYFGRLNLKDEKRSAREKFTQDTIVLLERFIPEVMFFVTGRSAKKRYGLDILLLT